jgi:general secretion pathway protein L
MVMQEKIVIDMQSGDPERPSWVVFDADSIAKHSVHQGEVSELAESVIDRQVMVLVPAADVLLTHTKLPKMSRSRLMQALPFAVEDQLIDDVEDVHVVAGDYKEDHDLPVAIVTHEKMKHWLAILKSWHIQADVLTPVTLALPREEHTWHMMLDEMAVVRTADCQGFVCDRGNIATILNLALASAQPSPQAITIHNLSNHAFTLALNLAIPVNETFIHANQMLTVLAQTVIRVPCLNLLQGVYAVKRSRMPQLSKVWQVTSYFAIAWVCLLFLYPVMSFFILHSRVSSIESQIDAIYMRQFPHATSIIAPRLRLEEKLHKLTSQIGENRLLLLLAYVGQGMSETPSVQLKRFDYQNNQLTMEIVAPTSEEFSAFTDFLSQQGLSVKQQNANLAGSRMNATLLVE